MKIKLLPLLLLLPALIITSATASAGDPDKDSFLPAASGAGIDLKGRVPEDFDWDRYFSAGDQSTGGQMELARNAAALLKKRIDTLCAQYRALMTKRGDTDAVKVFDQMQEFWEKSADAEVEFVGSAWDGGSGAREAYPKHR